MSLVERSGELLVLWRADGSAAYVSPALRALLGLSDVEPAPAHADFPVLAEERERWGRAFQDSLGRPGVRVQVELRCTTRAGATCWLGSTLTNLLDDPEVASVVAFFRDISPRKRVQAELEESRRRLLEMLAATRTVTYVCQAGDHLTAFVSENVREMTGHRAEDFLADSGYWARHLHPEDRDRVLAAFAAPSASRVDLEYRFRCADGRFLWVHDAATVLRDEQGRPLEYAGYWVDIDARKRAEEALRSSERTFRKLIENLPTAMLVRQGDEIVWVNKAMLALLGYARADELIGRTALAVVHPADVDLVRRRMASADEVNHTRPVELRWLRRDRSTVVVEVESLIIDLDGAPAAAVFARDLTERRLLQARSATADRMASVGMLASGVAHEINNPLAFVSSNLAVLADAVPRMLRGEGPGRVALSAGDVARLLADAQEGAARVAAVVRDLRTLSQPEAGELGPVDVCAALRSAVKMAGNALASRAQVVERFESVPPVRAREARLVQVFLNLLVNAGQAIAEGAPEQNRVELRVHPDPSGRVAVDVEDTGEGIAAEVMPRIFDPFFTTKRSGEGTGLGLAISQTLVLSFGGELRVRSQRGHGATFTVLLEAMEPVAALPAEPAPRRVSDGARPRILVVDDEARFGTSLKLLLMPEYEVETQTEPRAALRALLQGARYDAIFCDLTMPDMDGIELHAELQRALPEVARRVIFLTGGAVTERARAFLDATSQLCLQKPARHEVLVDAIERVRSGAPAGSELRG